MGGLLPGDLLLVVAKILVLNFEKKECDITYSEKVEVWFQMFQNNYFADAFLGQVHQRTR